MDLDWGYTEKVQEFCTAKEKTNLLTWSHERNDERVLITSSECKKPYTVKTRE